MEADNLPSTSEDGASQGGFSLISKNPYLFGVASFSTLGGLLFGYDQGVVSGVITMESFGARFPRVYTDSGFKGWFVSTLLLAAWLGSLINGPIADRLGRKMSIMLAVVVFVVGSAVQCSAVTVGMLFSGRAVAGFAVGQLTMVVPLYISEVSIAEIRGSLVVLQQLSITIGILLSYWIDYAANNIGGTRCIPDNHSFDPHTDLPPNGVCPGQSEASWRLPLALQIVPALVLGVGMVFFPDSPRWLLMRRRDGEALETLARLRRCGVGADGVRSEFLDVKAVVILEECERKDGERKQYISLFTTWPRFRRLAIGCCVMFFQQFMGCNAMIYYAPTIFHQLGLDDNTTSLLATGVYGIVNCLSTLPALFLIDRIGRRVLLMSGAIGTCISLVIVGGILGAYGEELVNHRSAGWAGIAFIYIYDINFSYSFAPIGWVLPSEIFNLSIRSKAISITTSATWMCNFIIGLITPDMLESITWGTYIFFAAFCLLALAFTVFCVPETRGKTLEDMDLIFGDTAAHEEKQRILQIGAQLRGSSPTQATGGLRFELPAKPSVEQEEHIV